MHMHVGGHLHSGGGQFAGGSVWNRPQARCCMAVTAAHHMLHGVGVVRAQHRRHPVVAELDLARGLVAEAAEHSPPHSQPQDTIQIVRVWHPCAVRHHSNWRLMICDSRFESTCSMYALHINALLICGRSVDPKCPKSACNPLIQNVRKAEIGVGCRERWSGGGAPTKAASSSAVLGPEASCSGTPNLEIT